MSSDEMEVLKENTAMLDNAEKRAKKSLDALLNGEKVTMKSWEVNTKQIEKLHRIANSDVKFGNYPKCFSDPTKSDIQTILNDPKRQQNFSNIADNFEGKLKQFNKNVKGARKDYRLNFQRQRHYARHKINRKTSFDKNPILRHLNQNEIDELGQKITNS